MLQRLWPVAATSGGGSSVPSVPQAGHEHVAGRLWVEVQHADLRFFAGAQGALFEIVQRHVFIKALYHAVRVVAAELVFPEAFKVVAPRVVEPGIATVGARGFSARAAMVAHGFDDVFACLANDHRDKPEGKDARVVAVRLGALEIGELGAQPGDPVGGDALVVLGFLGGARLELALGIGETGFLLEKIDLPLAGGGRLPGRDVLGDALRGGVLGIEEIRFQTLGELDVRTRGAAGEEILKQFRVDTRIVLAREQVEVLFYDG
jgi:hypothetical protein